MKIIRYLSLNSTNSINTIAINSNQQYIAFGDSNKQITIFKYQNLLVYIQSKPNPEDTNTTDSFASYFIQETNLPKIKLDYHTEQISSIVFAHTQNNVLFSGSYDKTIALWRINPQAFQAEKSKSIKMPSEITELAFYPDDSFLFVGCFDNCIYIIKCNFYTNSYETVNKIATHDNIINSISLDPHIEETNRIASLSDKGRFILSSFNKTDSSVNSIHNYEDFVDPNHKCTIHQKKIDWSVDGKWIISVDHHLIRKQKIIHAKLLNLNSSSPPQALIGHDSPVLIAKFSKCLYNYNGNSAPFQMLSTGDRNGNLIIWRFDDSQFKVLCEITNCSESNITSMLWAPTGEYLFIANSSGTVSIIIFDEFDIKLLKSQGPMSIMNEMNSKANVDPFNPMPKQKRVIRPEKIPEKPLIDSLMEENNYHHYQSNNHKHSHEPVSKVIAPCLRCERQMHQVIETQVYNVKLDMLNPHNVVFTYENKPYDNNCILKLTVNSAIIYAIKCDNRMIKLLKANNFFYAFYDTNFTLNVFTIFNTTLMTRVYIEEVSLIESYERYLLLLTSQNRMIIIDTCTQKNILDEYLLIASEAYNVFQTKIDKIVFLALDKIILYANTFNVYKNTNVKLVFLFNCTNHSLVQVTNIVQCEEMIKEQVVQVNSIKSIYNDYLEKYIDEEKREVSLEDLFKCSNLILMYEEQMKECIYFGKKDVYIETLKKVFDVIKSNENMKYKLYDVVKGSVLPDEIKNEVEQIINNVFSSEHEQLFLQTLINKEIS